MNAEKAIVSMRCARSKKRFVDDNKPSYNIIKEPIFNGLKDFFLSSHLHDNRPRNVSNVFSTIEFCARTEMIFHAP